MKTRIVLAAAVAASMTAPLAAQSADGVILTNTEFGAGFKNSGLCTAALAKVRNMQRADASLRGEGYRDLSASAFQKESLRTTRCEKIEADGMYRVVFYANGIPN